MAELPTGTVTFLFTDIEGSTRLAKAYPAQWEAARLRHHSILRAAIEAQQGYIFQIIGDAFCVAFSTALDALAAAVNAQRALQAEAWGETPIRVRMGLHTGGAEFRDGDYHGYLTLAHVQRVMSPAYGGQTLLSNATAALLSEQLPIGIALRDMGEHRLKGLPNPEHLWQVVAHDLPTEFPPLQSLNTIPNKLPIQVTSFVGREHELSELRRLLATIRLLTLTGSGGTGKTRLALQAAAEELATFPDGVWCAELAPLTDASLISNAIASAIGVREVPGCLILDSLSDHLRDKHALLIVDNCEHVLTGCAHVVSHLLHATFHLKIVTTSREALNIVGEQVYPVPSLRMPETDMSFDTLPRVESMQLFAERARAIQPSFSLTRANAAAVAAICQRLDGLPLAIELAAARVRLLPPQKLLAQLGNRLRLLTSSARDLPARQQTLRGMIDWSYELLLDSESKLFRQLAVFIGGCTLEAAGSICNADGTLDVLNGLQSLLDKSLLQQIDVDGDPRFGMLETIREYAHEKLLESGEGPHMHAQHLNVFVQIAEEAEPKLYGPEQVQWLTRVEQDNGNIRAALGWALEHSEGAAALRLSGALARFWSVRGFSSEGRQWLEQALALSQHTANPAGMSSEYRGWRAKAASTAGSLAWIQGDYATARAHHEESLALSRELGDQQGIANSLNNLGNITYVQGDNLSARALFEESLALKQKLGNKQAIADSISNLGVVAGSQGDNESARTLHEQSLALRRELADKHGIATSLNNLGVVAGLQGDFATAKARHEESLALKREIGHKSGIGDSLINLGNISLEQGDCAAARVFHQEALVLKWELGNKKGIAECLVGFAGVAQGEGDPLRAARLLGTVEALLERIGARLDKIDRLRFDRTLAAVHSQLEGASFDAERTSGRAMTMEQAIAFALE